MEIPILTEKTLRNYSIVEHPCTTRCTVAATVLPHNVVPNIDPYYVVHLRAITIDKYLSLKKILVEEPCLDFMKYKDYFLSGFLFENQIKKGYDLPTKGEDVMVTFKYSVTQTMRASTIDLIPRYNLKRVDNDLLAPYLKIFKQYFNEKLSNKPYLSSDEGDTIPEL